MFDDLEKIAGLGEGCRVLEIGPGTGKATVDLARRGATVTAVELGPNLAAVAARNVPTATIIVGAFETWALPAEPFDLVLAATAYHWLDPTIRVTKAAQALRPGGVLAVIETHHVAGPDLTFAAMQECYERWDPTTPPGFRAPTIDEVPRLADAGELFEPATFHRYAWDLAYSTESYLDLLRTYSNHRAMAPAQRAGLLGCLGDLIDRHGGRVTKSYLTQLWTARRR